MTARSTKADYIIIGGGLTCCTLASRLAKGNPCLSILILEAGADAAGQPLTSVSVASFAAHHSDIDWTYTTVLQRQLDNLACYQGTGKGLSRGSAINHGAWVRGPAVDFDVGEEGWGYAGLLRYFKRSE